MKNNSKSTFDKIIKTVCEVYGISEKRIKSRSRRRVVVLPRQVAHYLLRKNRFEVMFIGDYFKLDHSTITHSCNTIQNLISLEIDVLQSVRLIESKIIRHGLL